MWNDTLDSKEYYRPIHSSVVVVPFPALGFLSYLIANAGTIRATRGFSPIVVRNRILKNYITGGRFRAVLDKEVGKCVIRILSFWKFIASGDIVKAATSDGRNGGFAGPVLSAYGSYRILERNIKCIETAKYALNKQNSAK
jgi:hypothetical protein